MMKRANTKLVIENWNQWLTAWNLCLYDEQRIGLLDIVMRVQTQKPQVIKGSEIHRYRFLLQTADLQSGYSDAVKRHAFMSLFSKIKSSRTRFIPDDGYNRAAGYRSLMWLLRIKRSENSRESREWYPTNRNLVQSNQTQLREWLARECSEVLLKKWWHSKPRSEGDHLRILQRLYVLNADTMVIEMRRMLFPGRHGCIRGEVQLRRDRCQRFDAVTIEQITNHVLTLKHQNLETALERNDPLASLLVQLASLGYTAT